MVGRQVEELQNRGVDIDKLSGEAIRRHTDPKWADPSATPDERYISGDKLSGPMLRAFKRIMIGAGLFDLLDPPYRPHPAMVDCRFFATLPEDGVEAEGWARAQIEEMRKREIDVEGLTVEGQAVVIAAERKTC